jgi:hypothetical protein
MSCALQLKKRWIRPLQTANGHPSETAVAGFHDPVNTVSLQRDGAASESGYLR